MLPAVIELAEGRYLRPGDRRRAVVGAAFAASRGLAPGDTLTLEGEAYEVVGVLERMQTAPDRFVIVPIAVRISGAAA